MIVSDNSSEWVVYHPPKSVSFGHQSRIRDPRRAWPMVKQFLGELTEFTLGHNAELTCRGPDIGLELSVAMTRIREARYLFGPEINPSETNPRWKIGNAQLEVAIRFALDDDRFSQQQLAPTWFHFYYRFVWKDFEKLPYKMIEDKARYRASTLGISFDRRLFLQPNFVFPAPWTSEFLRNFIARIEVMAPFRFRDQYFKRWLPPVRRGGTGYGRYLNLHKSWRKAVV